jgi:hypothetical protein
MSVLLEKYIPYKIYAVTLEYNTVAWKAVFRSTDKSWSRQHHPTADIISVIRSGKRESQSSFNSTPRSHKATKSKAGVSAYWMPTAIGHKNMAMGSEPEIYEPSKFEAPSATSLSIFLLLFSSLLSSSW